MNDNKPLKYELLAIIIAFIIVFSSVTEMIGKPARLVLLLPIIGGSIGIGISICRLVERVRREKEMKEAARGKGE